MSLLKINLSDIINTSDITIGDTCKRASVKYGVTSNKVSATCEGSILPESMKISEIKNLQSVIVKVYQF